MEREGRTPLRIFPHARITSEVFTNGPFHNLALKNAACAHLFVEKGSSSAEPFFDNPRPRGPVPCLMEPAYYNWEVSLLAAAVPEEKDHPPAR